MITVNQIAKICGVSRTTVIRALNDQGRVSERTREQVLTVANENGYRPNLLARSLNKGRTMSIGVIADSVNNYVFAESLDAINRETQKRGYSLNIALQQREPKSEIKCIQEMADRKVEGLLITPVNHGPKYENFLKTVGMPVVCLGNWVSDAISTVMVDERHATQEAMHLIAEHGYKRVVFVCPPLEDAAHLNIYSHQQRLAGVESERGLFREVLSIGHSDYLKALEQMLPAASERTALLCSGDIYALSVLRWAKERGLEIPHDFGLMGFDDINVLNYIDPPLSTVSTNVEGVAKVAVAHLMAIIEDPTTPPQKMYLNYRVVNRSSL